MKILITGCAGFIGYHLAKKLAELNHDVHGIDNFNSYYNPDLKWDRVDLLKKYKVKVTPLDITSGNVLNIHISWFKPDLIIHLAAYAGVRHSLTNPNQYIWNNVFGTSNVIEACRKFNINKVIYASTSCVMAGNKMPWTESDKLGHQLNPYGYTKAMNESQFIASSIPVTIGLRFFTVYGPYGRPDMALFDFTKNIIEDKPITLFNYGDMIRDFTYIDDIIKGITIIVDEARKSESNKEIYNIGYGEKISLARFVNAIEDNLNKKAIKLLAPKHPADTYETWSDTTKLQKLGWKPTVSVEDGIQKFINWYKDFYNE